MANKLVAGDFNETHTVKVYWSYENQEYTVKSFIKINGKLRMLFNDYFTNDKEDALSTAKAILRSYK